MDCEDVKDRVGHRARQYMFHSPTEISASGNDRRQPPTHGVMEGTRLPCIGWESPEDPHVAKGGCGPRIEELRAKAQ